MCQRFVEDVRATRSDNSWISNHHQNVMDWRDLISNFSVSSIFLCPYWLFFQKWSYNVSFAAPCYLDQWRNWFQFNGRTHALHVFIQISLIQSFLYDIIWVVCIEFSFCLWRKSSNIIFLEKKTILSLLQKNDSLSHVQGETYWRDSLVNFI